MLECFSKIRGSGQPGYACLHCPSWFKAGYTKRWLNFPGTKILRVPASSMPCTRWPPSEILRALSTSPMSLTYLQCFCEETQNKNGDFLWGTFSFNPRSFHLVQEFLLGMALEANILIKHKTLLTFPSWVTLAQGLVSDWTLSERGDKNIDIQNASRLAPFKELAKPDVKSIWLRACIYSLHI